MQGNLLASLPQVLPPLPWSPLASQAWPVPLSRTASRAVAASLMFRIHSRWGGADGAAAEAVALQQQQQHYRSIVAESAAAPQPQPQPQPQQPPAEACGMQEVGRMGRLVALQAGDNQIVTLPASIEG